MILFRSHPEPVAEEKLRTAVEYSNPSDFRTKVLKPLHKAAKIDYRNGAAGLLPPGIQAAVEIARASRDATKRR